MFNIQTETSAVRLPEYVNMAATVEIVSEAIGVTVGPLVTGEETAK